MERTAQGWFAPEPGRKSLRMATLVRMGHGTTHHDPPPSRGMQTTSAYEERKRNGRKDQPATASAFDLIRYRRNDGCVFLYAFDLIELNGDDLRRDPLVVRKATLTSVLAKARVGIRYNEHLEFDDGEAGRPRLQDGWKDRRAAQGLGLSLRPLAGLARR